MWFVRSPERLDEEMRSVTALISEGWVSRVSWRFLPDEGLISADLVFTAGGKKREAELRYPQVFPYAPPQVIPKGGARWSSHQWPSGELCLQYRAQTWRTELTGADLLQSARHLLDTEAQKDAAGRQREVPSAHERLAESLRLRNTYFRLVLQDDLLAELRRRAPGVWKIECRDAMFGSSADVMQAVRLAAVDDSDGWVSPSAPPHFAERYRLVQNGRIALLDLGDARHAALTKSEITPAELWAAFAEEPLTGLKIVVGVLPDQVIVKMLSSSVHEVAALAADQLARNPERNLILASKKVLILGCGSMGTKVAASLARAGVGAFVLVDGDVLKAGNLVRNDLDWGEVGAHKVDGLAQRLERINPQASISYWKRQLGQASTSTLVKDIASLADCDLIVEVTGNALGFNYAGAVAAEHDIPMVWGGVFAGGYGGFIARSRPGHDPTPHDVRNLIDRWCANPDFPKPPAAGDIDYSAEADDQPPMIADDGDVSVISSHLARFATDALRPAEQTDYPYSAYMIGLRKEWIFDQPFETHPIDLTASLDAAPAGASLPVRVQVAGSDLIRELPIPPFKKKQ